jgi:plasmid stabilization system protein ParE
MPKPRLEFKEEAKQEIIIAAGWYREQQPGLDARFLAAIHDTTRKIIKHPKAGLLIYKNLRQARVKKFPYVIIYGELDQAIIIFQVFNTWQHPKKRRRTTK